MKKVLVAFAVATTFAACGDNSTSTTSTSADSTGVKKDSPAVAPVTTPDTTTNKMGSDTTNKMSTDTTTKTK